MAADPERLADADYVLRWVWQNMDVPGNIHDLAARALGLPSLAHGMADDPPATDDHAYADHGQADPSQWAGPCLCIQCRKPLAAGWSFAVCEKCGKQCPHGNPPEDCNECMVEGDQAYDARRER